METTVPITVTENTRLPLKLVLTLLGLAVAGAATTAVMKFQLSDHERRIAKVEVDHATEHDVLIELRDDVKFLRQAVEHKR